MKLLLIWFIAGIFYLYEFVHRVIIGLMVPELSAAFNVSPAIAGEFAAFYFYSYGLAQIPVGLIIDRYGSRWSLSLSCLIISLASFILAGTNNLWLALLSRAAIGFCSAFAFVGCLKLGASWFPAHKFSFVVGLTNLLGMIGALIGGEPIAYALEYHTWREIMHYSGIIGLILSLILALVVKDKNFHAQKHSHIFHKLAIVIKNRKMWIIALFGGLLVAPIITYSELWGVSLLIQNYNLDRPTAALISTSTFIGIAIGSPIIGLINSVIKKPRLILTLASLSAFSIFNLILFNNELPIWFLYVLHITFGFATSSMLLCFSLNSEISEPPNRATVAAFTNTIIIAIGALMQTICSFTSLLPLVGGYLLAFICLCFIA